MVNMILGAGFIFPTHAILLTGQSQVGLLSANNGAIFTKELISIQKWKPLNKIKVVGYFDLSLCWDGHLPCNFVHQRGKLIYMEIESRKTVVCQKEVVLFSKRKEDRVQVQGNLREIAEQTDIFTIRKIAI